MFDVQYKKNLKCHFRLLQLRTTIPTMKFILLDRPTLALLPIIKIVYYYYYYYYYLLLII